MGGGGNQVQYYTPPDPGGASQAEVARLARLHAALGDDAAKNAQAIDKYGSNATKISEPDRKQRGNE
jgi:hypothetical protein